MFEKLPLAFKKVLLVVAVLAVVSFGLALVNYGKSSSAKTQTDTISAQNASAPSASSSYEVKLLSARKGKDTKNNDVVICRYEWTNHSAKTTCFAVAILDQCFENGIECEKDFYINGLEGDSFTNVQNGATYTIEQAYQISPDASQVNIVVKDAFSFDNVEYVNLTVTL